MRMRWLFERLNVVAALYRWSLASLAARRTTMAPGQLEAAMRVTRRGRIKRYYVLEAMCWKLLHIVGVVVVLVLACLGIARLVDEHSPTLASVLDRASLVFAVSPLALTCAVLVWSIRPERYEDGWFNHPGRLWVPSILTYVFTFVLAGIAN
jgi:hypothetical protein